MTAYEISTLIIQFAVVAMIAHRSRWCYGRAQEYINVKAFRQGDMLLTDSYRYAGIATVLFVLAIVNAVVMI